MTPNDRLKGSLAAFIKEQIPSTIYLGVYEYVTTAPTVPIPPSLHGTNTLVSATPTHPTAAGLPLPILPDLQKVPLLPSIIGGSVQFATLGVKFLVAFVNGDPTRPVVIAGDPNAAPTRIDLASPNDAQEAVLGAARFGDTVIAGAFVGTITSGSTIVRIGG